jgi:hypothetical protein
MQTQGKANVLVIGSDECSTKSYVKALLSLAKMCGPGCKSVT